MAQETIPIPHKLNLNDRKTLTVSGVTGVVGFDEETVLLHTSMGDLTIRGQGLQLKNLSLDGGQVAVSGNVNAMVYTESVNRGGFWRRLFG